MTDYQAVAASLRACTDPQKRHAADVIDELLLWVGRLQGHKASLEAARATPSVRGSRSAEDFRAWLVGEIEDRALRYHEAACPMYAEEARAIAEFIRAVEIEGGKPLTTNRGSEVVCQFDGGGACNAKARGICNCGEPINEAR